MKMTKRRYRHYIIDYRTYNYTLKKYHYLHREIYAENARDAVKMLRSKECNREFEIVKVGLLIFLVIEMIDFIHELM